jgi:hypothetical protein
VSAKVELIEDGGAAAADEEFFRSREFLEAEGVTHTLRIREEGSELRAPLCVRAVGDGPQLDAASPYGYPGVSGSLPAQLDPRGVDFASTGLVTIFLRHALGPLPLARTRERNLVQIADPRLPAKRRASDRNQINRNRRAGYEVAVVPGPESESSERAGFRAAYGQTMRRAAAAERYLFSADYFDRILAFERSWLALARDPEGEVAAASIAVQSDGFLHYYLSGTVDSRLRDSPMKNLVDALADFSAEIGVPLNLGGGISAGDPLEEFKRGFANRSEPWHASEIVCDPDAYARLAGGRDAGDFFPAYRAG